MTSCLLAGRNVLIAISVSFKTKLDERNWENVLISKFYHINTLPRNVYGESMAYKRSLLRSALNDEHSHATAYFLMDTADIVSFIYRDLPPRRYCVYSGRNLSYSYYGRIIFKCYFANVVRQWENNIDAYCINHAASTKISFHFLLVDTRRVVNSNDLQVASQQPSVRSLLHFSSIHGPKIPGEMIHIQNA